MGKTRVGVLLRDTVGGSKSSSNSSMDLEQLTQKYYQHAQHMQALLQSLRDHHASLQSMEASRLKISKQLAAFTKGTPLFDSVGLLPSADRPSNTVCSYASIHEEVSAKSKSYTTKYGQFVLDYAVEWDKIVSTRVENGIKKAKALRIELDHYQKKTESLRLSVNQAMARGKPVASTTQEKLRRNEEKLLASKQNYNQVATDVSLLLEEIVERSWRDLHPLLVKCSQFDMTLASDEARVLSQLQQVISGLKQVAIANGISPQPRLKDLAGLKPELLSTRPGGVVGLNVAGMIEGPTALAPGTVGAQGMGGFPVPVSPANNNTSADPYAPLAAPVPMMNRTNSLGTNSLGSAHSAPLSLLNTSYGAPPTADDVYGTGGTPTHGGAPLSMSQPSLPTTPNHWSVRSSSFNDADSAYSSVYSQASAPAPMGAPPPPPPGPPPASSNGYPPMQQQQQAPLSMYHPVQTQQQQQQQPMNNHRHQQQQQHGFNPYG